MPAESPVPPACRHVFTVLNYDLGATLSSGQVFRWHPVANGWEGVVGRHWVRLVADDSEIRVTTAAPVRNWTWLKRYLQIEVDLDAVIATFPPEEPLREAVRACAGLRLLRQDVWECLASFILSSTKQIVQIQQIVARMCEHFGEPVDVPPGCAPTRSFPTAERLAHLREADLRKCGMGFRAPYLLESARLVAAGAIVPPRLASLELEPARAALMTLPGVGRKIADCVLLFAVGQPRAFPVDVWILKTLRELYFSGRAVPLRQLVQFAETHFGPHGGYAQQYLFHHARLRSGRQPTRSNHKP